MPSALALPRPVPLGLQNSLNPIPRKKNDDFWLRLDVIPLNSAVTNVEKICSIQGIISNPLGIYEDTVTD